MDGIYIVKKKKKKYYETLLQTHINHIEEKVHCNIFKLFCHWLLETPLQSRFFTFFWFAALSTLERPLHSEKKSIFLFPLVNGSATTISSFVDSPASPYTNRVSLNKLQWVKLWESSAKYN